MNKELKWGKKIKAFDNLGSVKSFYVGVVNSE